MHSAALWWVAAQDREVGRPQKEPHEIITPEEFVENYSVPHGWFVEHLRTVATEEAACKTLPFTLLVVLAFTLSVVLHDPTVSVVAVEDSITHDITENANFAFSSAYIGHKSVYDVNSQADFWSWLIQGYVPLIFQQTQTFSEDQVLDHPDIAQVPANLTRGVLLNYNRIVGGVRIRQERSDDKPCETLFELVRFYGKRCVGGLGYELYPELPGATITTDPTREFWLYVPDDVNTMLDVLYTKEVDLWLDERTRKVEIVFPMFNVDVGLYSLVATNFYFSRGGHIWKRIIPMSTYSEWYDGYASAVVDIVWLLCLLRMSFLEFRTAFQAARASGVAGLRKHFTYWVIVDCCSIAFGLGIILLFFGRMSGSELVNKEFTSLLDLPDQPGRLEEYKAKVSVFVDALEGEVQRTNTLRLASGTYPLVVLLQMFKAFSAQPRLSIVTETLNSARLDLLHFLLVFISILLAFVVAGVVLFGRQVDDFTTFSRSFITCCRVLIGDFDWEQMLQVGRAEAALWFGSFTVVNVLLMMNMLLAIVMDAYAIQKSKVGEAETLWEEARHTFERLRGERNHSLVSLHDVLKALTTTDMSHFQRLRMPASNDSSSHQGLGASLTIEQLSLGEKSQSIRETREEEVHLVDVSSLCHVVDRALALRSSRTVEKGTRFMSKSQAEALVKDAVKKYYTKHKQQANVKGLSSALLLADCSTKAWKHSIGASIYGSNTEGTKYNNFSDGGDEAAPKFIHELNRCRAELRRTREWLGDAEEPVVPYSGGAAPSFGAAVQSAAVHHHMGPGTLATGTSIHEISEWSVKQILEDEATVLEACRAAHIGHENDSLRRNSLGRMVRVLQVDASDSSVKCRVPGVGDVWFGLGALTHVRPLTMAPTSAPKPLRSSADSDGWGQTGAIAASHGGEGESGARFIERGGAPALGKRHSPGNSSSAGLTQEGYQRKANDLEADLQVGRQSVTEALAAVEELERRLLREQREKAKLDEKMQLLKQQVASMGRDSVKLMKEAKRQEERHSVIESSRKEYYELVQMMSAKGQDLRAQLREITFGRSGSKPRKGSTLPKEPMPPRVRLPFGHHSGGGGGTGGSSGGHERQHAGADKSGVLEALAQRIPELQRGSVSPDQLAAELRHMHNQVQALRH